MSGRRVSFSARARQDQPAPAPTGLGAAAFLPPEPAPAAHDQETPAVSAVPEPAAEETWEASHKRVTFYCPVDLLDELARAVRTTGRSKSQLLVKGLRLALRESEKGRR